MSKEVNEQAAAETSAKEQEKPKGNPKKIVEIIYDGIYPEVIIEGVGPCVREVASDDPKKRVPATRVKVAEPLATELVERKGFKLAR